VHALNSQFHTVRIIALTFLALFYQFACLTLSAAAAEKLRVMTYNLWHGGDASQQPLDQTVKVIRTAEADVVGVQETSGNERDGIKPDNAEAIAHKLSWHYFNQGDGTGVISRYPIVRTTPKKWGVQVELPSKSRVWAFNVHFAHAPYQPYQLLKIPYEDAPFIETAEEAVGAAHLSHGPAVASLLREISQVRDDAATIFVTGDFNEPSVLDWTDAVWRAGRCPVAVRWPSTAALHRVGFVDGYREAHPDPLKAPGYTWTPTTAENDPKDRHDRIDFVFVGGRRATVELAEVVGESRARADIVVAPYPSDHRAVVVTVQLR
jgi:exonuclease III